MSNYRTHTSSRSCSSVSSSKSSSFLFSEMKTKCNLRINQIELDKSSKVMQDTDRQTEKLAGCSNGPTDLPSDGLEQQGWGWVHLKQSRIMRNHKLISNQVLISIKSDFDKMSPYLPCLSCCLSKCCLRCLSNICTTCCINSSVRQPFPNTSIHCKNVRKYKYQYLQDKMLKPLFLPLVCF